MNQNKNKIYEITENGGITLNVATLLRSDAYKQKKESNIEKELKRVFKV